MQQNNQFNIQKDKLCYLISVDMLLSRRIAPQLLILGGWTAIKLVQNSGCRSIQALVTGYEFIHGLGRKHGCFMVYWRLMVHLMDGHGGVHNLGLDDILLDNWLDVLVDMVVSVYSLHSSRRRRFLGIMDCFGILIPGLVFCKCGLELLVAALVHDTLLYRHSSGCVLSRPSKVLVLSSIQDGNGKLTESLGP